MRHILAIAGRELGSLFASPVAYVVLTLWSLLAGAFFLSSLVTFEDQVYRVRTTQPPEALAMLNLNDALIGPFIASMWIVLLFLLPAVTMPLFAAEKSEGTEELLLTSPLGIWEIVLGKFLAGAAFAGGMTAIVAFFPGLLFFYGEPELGKTAGGLLGLFLVAVMYVSVGGFASALTRSQLIAFMATLALLLVLGILVPFLVEIALAGVGQESALLAVMDWVSTGRHMEASLAGLVNTADLAYFACISGAFLLLTKTAVESARWR